MHYLEFSSNLEELSNSKTAHKVKDVFDQKDLQRSARLPMSKENKNSNGVKYV